MPELKAAENQFLSGSMEKVDNFCLVEGRKPECRPLPLIKQVNRENEREGPLMEWSQSLCPDSSPMLPNSNCICICIGIGCVALKNAPAKHHDTFHCFLFITFSTRLPFFYDYSLQAQPRASRPSATAAQPLG
ncbi:hypothetical protein QQP08_012135 [Theobroma cacao]|uniref:Uncharacterized protein n=1 Tax=Theobroma cacao TaxID=3641 RepID=A0A061EQF0_THECC|nr:Uncharacterized protein TCM_021483 [Theobroma cacao]WRX19648.1 hypothetical protein QQP08_012135 [Theobroma cacao]